MPDTQAVNTDRELWRGPDEGIFVTEGGGIGIDCGGHVIVMPIRKWFALAQDAALAASEPDK